MPPKILLNEREPKRAKSSPVSPDQINVFHILFFKGVIVQKEEGLGFFFQLARPYIVF
jgi:hypothetical protein